MQSLAPGLPSPLRSAYKWMPLVGINTWVWSIIYHTRDCRWTERMDYFSAAINTLFWFYQGVLRLSDVYQPDERSKTWRRYLQLAFVGLFVAHCTYLTLWRFDYR